MCDSVLHIVFSETVAGSLIPALRAAGRDRVVHLADDLSFGPINPPDPAARRDWIQEQLGIDVDDAAWSGGRIDDFWKAALSGAVRRVAWVSKRTAHEYAGFLEFVWRLGDAPCDVVEFDRDQITYLVDGRTKRSLVLCLGELAPRHFEDKRYWERAAPLDAAARARYRANWALLRGENAPLRILDKDGLISAPITYFDNLLLSCAVDRWRKVARVLGEALVSFCDGPFSQVAELVLHSRIRSLASAGRLESQGDLRRPRFSEVRLPVPEPTSATVNDGEAPPASA